jgi:thiol-disulfide isomerase/thioredoxin
MEGAGWLSQSFAPPRTTEMVDEKAVPKVRRCCSDIFRRMAARRDRPPALQRGCGRRRGRALLHASGARPLRASTPLLTAAAGRGSDAGPPHAVLPPTLHPLPLSLRQPAPKPRQLPEIGPRMAGIRSDADLAAFLSDHKARSSGGGASSSGNSGGGGGSRGGGGSGGVAVVEFGTSWCVKCHEMFPTFYALSKKASKGGRGEACVRCRCRCRVLRRRRRGPERWPATARARPHLAQPPPLERARARRPQYPQHAYAVAQLETLSPAATAGMRYTPTFSIYRGGRKVDEVVGKEPQRLEDHLWLHSD